MKAEPRSRGGRPRQGFLRAPGFSQAAPPTGSAVAHFCSNQAVRFAAVLPEVPSPKTSSLPRVWNHPSVSVSVKVSLADFVKMIRCHGGLAIRLPSPCAEPSCFGS